MWLIKALVQHKSYIILLLVLISLQQLFLYAKVVGFEKNETMASKWALTAYNFGGLEKLEPHDQISLLKSKGYEGIILRGAKQENSNHLDVFINETRTTINFDIQSVFVRYNFLDTELERNRWKTVVDKIAGKDIQLWFIYGKIAEGFSDVFIEYKLRELANYAAQNKVEVILCHHSKCYIESAEEVLFFVSKINHPNLNLAIHLYHEIRAENGSRIPEDFENVKHKLGAVTMAGADSIADFTTALSMDRSTIKVLGQGNFEMKNFIQALKKSEYVKPVGFMNFRIEKEPEVYLETTSNMWEKLLVNEMPEK